MPHFLGLSPVSFWPHSTEKGDPSLSRIANENGNGKSKARGALKADYYRHEETSSFAVWATAKHSSPISHGPLGGQGLPQGDLHTRVQIHRGREARE